MARLPSPDALHSVVAPERYDVFLSFTRTTPGAEDEVGRIANALTKRGLTVFLDYRIDEFTGITAALLNALAGSTVLLAHYSRQYPTRYACQWELTAAFLAAQRSGDPCSRVLVINPDAPAHYDHIAPIELADARFFGALRAPEDFAQLAERVDRMVRAAPGPLGAAGPVADATRLPPQVQRPLRFSGRYSAMWEVHSGLRGMDFAGVHPPGSRPAVLLTGLPGSGKSSTSAQYAYLYRDAYPGGIFWVGPLAGADHDAGSVLARYTDELRGITESLGVRVDGVSPARLRSVVANHLTEAGRRTLWIVDDIPARLPPEVLDDLLIPSPQVRTLLTSRLPLPAWDVHAVRLAGLDPEEAVALFADLVALEDESERDAVRALARRCGGHPMVVRAVANTARHRIRLGGAPDLVRYVDAAAGSLTDAVALDVAELEPASRAVLRVAAVLAPGHFPPVLAARALANAGEQFDIDQVGSAADELSDRGLLQTPGPHWDIHPLVCDLVRDDAEIPAVARAAAVALLEITGEMTAGLVAHAQHLGLRDDVAVGTRLALLRRVYEHYETVGDARAACSAVEVVLAMPCAVRDLVAAARIRIACGRYRDALAVAQEALAEGSGDRESRYRAAFSAAQALDHLGEYVRADELFWASAEHAEPPGWLAAEERFQVVLATATARRLRGRPKEALAVVTDLVERMRGVAADDTVMAAAVEEAQLLQMTGNARAARAKARAVAEHYRAAGMGEHGRAAEAECVAAEATLAVDLTEHKARPEEWGRSERELRRLADQYADSLGPDNALTLAVRVRADRALLAIGAPNRALSALAETERDITRHLGPDHYLLLRTVHGKAMAYGQRRQFDRQAELLEPLLAAQIARWGTRHPETVGTQLDLGIALAFLGHNDRARRLVDEAARELRHTLGPTVVLTTQAMTAQAMLRLPPWMFTTFLHIERFFAPREGA